MSAPLHLLDQVPPVRGAVLRRLNSRWVIVPAAFVIVIVVWITYVGSHDHGIVEGRVVDAAGRPVAGDRKSVV